MHHSNNRQRLARLIGAGLLTTSLLPLSAQATFSLTSSDEFYSIDTDAGVEFSIRRTDNGVSTQSAGDIASLKIHGQEYQSQIRGSQINSGFDWLYSGVSAVSVDAQMIGDDFIKVSVQAGDLTHYYLARRGYPNIYMATYFTSEPNVHNLVRYILRLDRNLLPYSPQASDLIGITSTVEASDIFALPNGETRSKHYSNMRLKDWQYIGATSDTVGVWVVRDDHEGGSGGPFYRSLLNQGTPTDQEITYIVNYGQAQTEAFRPGILNHYTLVVNEGQAPGPVDTRFFADMDLNGFVPRSERGNVVGLGFHKREPHPKHQSKSASGKHHDTHYTVGFANSSAQYWADANAHTSHFTRRGMLPGTYTMTTYKNELAIDSREVTIEAGKTTFIRPYTIEGDPGADKAIWRIGKWDGAPQEFLNGDKLTVMHPSDVRLDNWDSPDYVVGESADSSFPAYMWKDINNDHKVYFKLKASELTEDHQLRIGITCAFAGGRPMVTLNDWNSGFPAASAQPRTRNLTTGSYRCNNTTYSFDIPASAWKTNEDEYNELTVTVISGTKTLGYLSPSISVDALDLLK